VDGTFVDRRLYFLLNVAQQAIRKRVDDEALERVGLTSAQCGALFYVAKHDGCLLKELAEGLGLKNAAITGLVARTEKTGCLRRDPSPDDARATKLHLTPKGQRKLREIQALNQTLQARLSEGFDESELSLVARFLEHVVAVGRERS